MACLKSVAYCNYVFSRGSSSGKSKSVVVCAASPIDHVSCESTVRTSQFSELVSKYPSRYCQSANRNNSNIVVKATSSPASSIPTDESLEELVEKSQRYFSADSRPIVLFDGVCTLCNAGANFVVDNDPKGKLRLAALQSEAGHALLARSGRSPDDISTIVLVEKDKSYVKSDAVLRIGQLLQVPFSLLSSLALLTPPFIRDKVYDAVADNRYKLLGNEDECRMYLDDYEERFLE